MTDKEEGKKKLVVDKDACISCGACYEDAPELFESDDEGKSIVIKQPESKKEIKKAKESPDSCPTQAISY